MSYILLKFEFKKRVNIQVISEAKFGDNPNPVHIQEYAVYILVWYLLYVNFDQCILPAKASNKVV